MGSCLASCACGFCGSLCGGLCAKGNDAQSGPKTRLPYLMLMFSFTILALILRYYGTDTLVHIYFFHVSCHSCMGFAAVYRISFALFVFFAGHALMMTSGGTSKQHTSGWCTKLLLMVILIFLGFVIPNSFYDVYADIARFVAAVFLLLQIMILIDFSYKWQEDWYSDEKNMVWQLMVATLLFYAGSLVLCIFCFRWFGGSDCGTNKFLMSVTIIATIATSILSLLLEKGVLPAAIMTMYCWYINYSAMSSGTHCNPLDNDSIVQVVIGCIIGAVSVTYMGWSLAGASLWDDEDEQDDRAVPLTKGADSAAEESGYGSSSPNDLEQAAANEDDEESVDAEETRKENLKFHAIMAVASMYMAMVVTNWGSKSATSDSYDTGAQTYWIKAVSEWMTLLLYAWTLVADRVLTNRDFD